MIADTHLLGPFKGHWFDKLRREWQMKTAFMAANTLHSPDAVFFLGMYSYAIHTKVLFIYNYFPKVIYLMRANGSIKSNMKIMSKDSSKCFPPTILMF